MSVGVWNRDWSVCFVLCIILVNCRIYQWLLINSKRSMFLFLRKKSLRRGSWTSRERLAPADQAAGEVTEEGGLWSYGATEKTHGRGNGSRPQRYVDDNTVAASCPTNKILKSGLLQLEDCKALLILKCQVYNFVIWIFKQNQESPDEIWVVGITLCHVQLCHTARERSEMCMHKFPAKSHKDTIKYFLKWRLSYIEIYMYTKKGADRRPHCNDVCMCAI